MSSPLGILNSNTILSINYHSNKPYDSLFNNNQFYYRPISAGKSAKDTNKNGSVANDNIYDISLPSIIQYTEKVEVGGKKPMRLRLSDFMYLKDLGLYPNNRLIICRRFKSGVENDLTIVGSEPISTIVSWVAEGQEIMNFKFGEDWTDASPKDPIALFDSVFKAGIGTTVGGGFSGLGDATTKAIPFGGVSEALNFKLLDALGIKSDAAYNNLPSGNPNFIGEAKMRSSLKSDISFDIETTYEQKFYGKIDPSIVFLDLMNNILRFGSSESMFYITGASDKITRATNAFTTGNWALGAGILVGAFVSAIKNLVSGIGDFITKSTVEAQAEYFKKTEAQRKEEKTVNDTKEKNQKEYGTLNDVKSAGIVTAFNKTLDNAMNLLGTIVVSKYRIQIASVINVMTGNPSTPWHVTVGNPKKPTFSSGDMYIDGSVEVKMGAVLAYNDLPSTITVKFTIRSARPLGIQEIFERFNVGGARVYNKTSYINRSKDFFESPIQNPTSSFNEGYQIGNPTDPTKK